MANCETMIQKIIFDISDSQITKVRVEIDYSVAYLCHCLGHTDVTPERVHEFRQQTHKWEGMFPVVSFGTRLERFWDYIDSDETEKRRFWLGPDTREWVESHLAQGKFGLAIVERVPQKAHALVVLESKGDRGVFVMDPLDGHRIDTWEWFLSVGAGHHGAHRIDGWYH
jgi:hypothetical protein